MSRCIRKVEGEDFYIIYCNTVDMLWDGMWESKEVATLFIELQGNSKFNQVWNKVKGFQGIITKEDYEEIIQEVKNKNGKRRQARNNE
jgi:hypothetical protein